MARVAVVGGGASGLVAAIEAARSGADVVLYEEADRVGKKILATGNGRCNLSNADIMSDDYNRPEFVQEAMNELPPEDVLQMFVSAGLLVSEEDEGRIYPYSNKAATVVDVLRLCFTEAGARACCSSKVERIVPAGEAGEVQNAALCENDGGRWALVCADGAVEAFDSVIVAVGAPRRKGLCPMTSSMSPRILFWWA
ncbi:MAG: NAD(P)/FAD-dependent oxidoreductase [Slackia sp.]